MRIILPTIIEITKQVGHRRNHARGTLATARERKCGTYSSFLWEGEQHTRVHFTEGENESGKERMKSRERSRRVVPVERIKREKKRRKKRKRRKEEKRMVKGGEKEGEGRRRKKKTATNESI